MEPAFVGCLRIFFARVFSVALPWLGWLTGRGLLEHPVWAIWAQDFGQVPRSVLMLWSRASCHLQIPKLNSFFSLTEARNLRCRFFSSWWNKNHTLVLAWWFWFTTRHLGLWLRRWSQQIWGRYSPKEQTVVDGFKSNSNHQTIGTMIWSRDWKALPFFPRRRSNWTLQFLESWWQVPQIDYGFARKKGQEYIDRNKDYPTTSRSQSKRTRTVLFAVKLVRFNFQELQDIAKVCLRWMMHQAESWHMTCIALFWHCEFTDSSSKLPSQRAFQCSFPTFCGFWSNTVLCVEKEGVNNFP